MSETPATAFGEPAPRFPSTDAVAFTEHVYAYEDRGGTRASAEKLGVPERSVIKTLVMEDEARKPLVVRGASSPLPLSG